MGLDGALSYGEYYKALCLCLLLAPFAKLCPHLWELIGSPKLRRQRCGGIRTAQNSSKAEMDKSSPGLTGPDLVQTSSLGPVGLQTAKKLSDKFVLQLH